MDALADCAWDADEATADERLVPQLDCVVGDWTAGIADISTGHEASLGLLIESAVESLIGHGMDALTAELLPADIAEIRGGGGPSPF